MAQAAVSVQVDFKKTLRAVQGINDRQLPFAVAVTLTRLAQGSQLRIRSEMERFFTLRSKNRMQKGVRIKAAKKSQWKSNSMHSEVNDIDTFIPLHITGGVKRAKSSRFVAIPDPALLAMGARTASGKIKKSRKPSTIINKIKSFKTNPKKRKWGRHGRKRAFIQEGKDGTPFIAMRTGADRYPLKFLWGFKRATSIKKVWPFAQTVAEYCFNNTGVTFKKAFRQALSSVK